MRRTRSQSAGAMLDRTLVNQHDAGTRSTKSGAPPGAGLKARSSPGRTVGSAGGGVTGPSCRALAARHGVPSSCRTRENFMVASRSARERKAAAEAGPLAQVRIDVGDDDQFVYKIRCRECTVRDGVSWSAWRRGEDNGYMAAMDRWTFHLVEKHPDADAPCLAYVDAARERQAQRLEQRRNG